ncbi:MAG: hypothetical protein K0U24_03285 [Gammaproteobacteria bacterium]|nr:hypothetical protein [Gammaproteobacteria bacterium]MCH9763239.1 hypothetical protein [Gammaproteobacteria bacterium]
MNKLTRRKKILSVLLLVFLAPGILAIIFYLNPSWLGGLPTNRGELIRPPVQLPYLSESTSEDKWHLTVWCPKGCDATCLHALDDMARVRLALGRRLYHVDLWVLQGEQGTRCSKEIVSAFKKEDVRTRVLTADEQESVHLLQDNTRVFLADPKHYLVLGYSAINASKDVFQDLKRLLNTREQA